MKSRKSNDAQAQVEERNTLLGREIKSYPILYYYKSDVFYDFK